jgi:hypothetical protein
MQRGKDGKDEERMMYRQATYTTTRLGIYTWLFEKFTKDGKPPSFIMKAGLGEVKF